MENKKYEAAQQELDTIVEKWKDWSNAYSLKAEVYLHQKDTVQAEKWLDKSLQLNPYDGDAWTTRAYMLSMVASMPYAQQSSLLPWSLTGVVLIRWMYFGR